MKIIFVDKNKSLVNKIKKAVKYFPVKIECINGDIFKQTGVIVSASNPSFSMGGGLDALIKKNYPEECDEVKKQEQIGNVMFVVTVDENLKATRKTVDQALAFALDGKNHLMPQTMLVSGLGTGIGGLDEDDFVWIFLKNISIAFGYGWGIKFTQKNGTDYKTGKVLYKSGYTLEVPEARKDNESCAPGLHLGNDFVGAGNYAQPEKIFFCIYDKPDLCHAASDKVRVSKLIVLTELPRWLGYGLNGKKIVGKIDKKINPEKFNPCQAVKLPTKNAIKKTKLAQVWAQVWDQVGDQVRAQVWAQVRDQVWDQVRAQVRDQVGAQVWDQVWAQVWDQVGDQVWAQVRAQVRAQVGDQVWDQVGDQVRAQVGDQVRAQVGDQVWDQVGDQVWDQVRAQVRDQVGDQVRAQVGAQVRAVSYWSINLHFSLGISHWFGDFLKLGVMPIFINGKIKFFGKKGKYLGEYNQEDLLD